MVISMHQERENLDILFRRTAPEAVLENIRSYGRFANGYPLKADALSYSYETYEHYSSLNMPEYSPDETQMRFRLLERSIKKDSGGAVYYALYEYAEKVLVMKGGSPVCRLDNVLGWNSISKRLGQDIFTTAWMAWKDAQEYDLGHAAYDAPYDTAGDASYYAPFKRRFSWPAVIKTDDRKLETIFEKGMAENHFHLHGSTQSFALSWACLMNHPECLDRYFGKKGYFMENLDAGVSKGILDNHMPWQEKMAYAAIIRALLFARCAGILDSREVWEGFKNFDSMPLPSKIKQRTEPLRMAYGARFRQKSNKSACLDYANSSYFYQVDEESVNRLLAGERSFLYHCFRRQFEREFTLQESSLLYLYILIKSQFRSELIQVNKRTGFTNFARYQDRKNLFFGEREEYWTEAQRLSIGAAMEGNHLVSLEARIMPRTTAAQMKQDIAGLDSRIRLAVGKNGSMPFYVVHFPKKKFGLKEFMGREYLLLPRNREAREGAEKKAKALVRYLRSCGRKDSRIYGMDACSLEIGCRPEVFATEFRYIRRYGGKRKGYLWKEQYGDGAVALGITYHAGEDFLDIIDGLRAVDEAMHFLPMEKGDRIGHALVLGINPGEYYRRKRRNVYLSKQDYLDNLVWMLYRSLELNVPIDANHRAKMQEDARRVLMEIYYGEDSSFGRKMVNRQPVEMLDMYYDSWKLRGDHPDLYRTGRYQKEISLSSGEYDSCKEGREFPSNYRQNEMIAGLYYRYHFDSQAKKKGLEPECYEVADWYVELAKDFQAALRKEIAKRGIAVECNPTSNVLIGTFGSYDKHPILALNNCHLDELSKDVHIQVSVNTDDIGVFDTSLENEYALLLCAICRTRHREGNYNDDAVYEYLDYLRENGVRMAFRQ